MTEGWAFATHDYERQHPNRDSFGETCRCVDGLGCGLSWPVGAVDSYVELEAEQEERGQKSFVEWSAERDAWLAGEGVRRVVDTVWEDETRQGPGWIPDDDIYDGLGWGGPRPRCGDAQAISLP